VETLFKKSFSIDSTENLKLKNESHRTVKIGINTWHLLIFTFLTVLEPVIDN